SSVAAEGALAGFGGISLERLPLTLGSAKFDLSLALAQGPAGIEGGLEVNLDLFDPATGRRMVAQVATLLAEMAPGPESRVIDLPLLSAAERSALLLEWSDTAQGRPESPLTHELFRAQALRRPEAVAVIQGERRLTYGELEAGSNRLAHHLHK